MQSLKFYGSVFVVGGIADLITNYATKNSTTGISNGLRKFYENQSPVTTAIYAGATFVVVVLVADFVYTKFL